MADLPLSGYRVTDFCWQAAGPLVTRALADWGAEVIKVESEVRVDRVREFHHPPLHATINTGAFFNDCNTNKESVTIDLGTQAGIDLVRELIAISDVVTTNFTPHMLERWGLGYEELCRVRPGIIMANFPALGTFGPHANWRAIGNGVTGLSGITAHTGFPGREPVGIATLHTDFTLAPLGAMQIMAALYEREETGEGCFLEVAQYEGAVHLLDTAVLDYLVNGTVAPRTGNRSAELAPHGVFPCAGPPIPAIAPPRALPKPLDPEWAHPVANQRWVAIAVRSTLEWQILCTAMGREDLATRLDLQTLEGRAAAADELETAIAVWTASQDCWRVAETLQARGVPAAPLENVADLVERDSSMATFYSQFAHPDGVEILVMNQPWLWNGERLPLRLSPLLGEHNEPILRNLLGKQEEEVADLVINGVIR